MLGLSKSAFSNSFVSFMEFSFIFSILFVPFKVVHAENEDLDRITKLELTVGNQNDRITFLENQRERQEKEMKALNEKNSKNEYEIDRLNNELLEIIHLKSDAGEKYAGITPVNRGKRPVRLLPRRLFSGNSDKRDDDNLLPSSCEDLSAFGHTLNGIYLAKEKTYNNFTKINAIFCNFKSGSSASFSVSEKKLGRVNVKTGNGIYFLVMTQGNPSHQHGTIKFDVERLNIGKAMNMLTGIFTAPKSGIYHFSFTFIRALGTDFDSLAIYFHINQKAIGHSFTKIGGSSSTMQVTVKLEKGDTVDLRKSKGTLIVKEFAHHFTGYLIEEELELM